jgi:hypothetical protein
VLAYGESAGGALASRLAEEGRVRAAAGFLTPADLYGGIAHASVRGMIDSTAPSAAELDALSPDRHRSRRPVLVQVGDQDLLLDTAGQWAWAQADPRVDAEAVHATHVFPMAAADRAGQVASAISFLRRKGLASR